ncbi:MAG: leucyl aminopeptidase [Pirellulaceae bacterium]|nr:leucyl aminopeptidase [Pirellulaceae bacterium]
MKHEALSAPLTEVEADAVVVGLYAGEPLSGAASRLNEASGGLVADLIESGEVSAKLGDVATLLACPGVRARLALLVGLGERAGLTATAAYQAANGAARKLAERSRSRIACFLAEGWEPRLQEAAVCGLSVGCQGQDLYRSEKKRHPFAQVAWHGVPADVLASGQILGESVNLARRLVNEPPDRMYPAAFAEQARQLDAGGSVQVEVWDEQKLRDERCGCLLGVAQGSDQPPRLVIMRYQGGNPQAPTLALVGKGVTFDSGGLSLKPSEGMQTMKCDMAGAATVLAALQAIARLRLPVNVTGYVGLVENMVSGRSFKLGDVLVARSGKTVEVLNTDAEGRLVLADVLDVAVQQQASRIIDLATLTGACVVALGNDVAGLMSNHQAWCDSVRSAADRCGELAWQLPMFKLYDEQIRSEVADLKNIGEGRWGGAITAGKFLEAFVGTTPWAHIDIAGPAFVEKPRPWTDAGATGAFVRTLVEVARAWPPA